jgi:hypothetical protein
MEQARRAHRNAVKPVRSGTPRLQPSPRSKIRVRHLALRSTQDFDQAACSAQDLEQANPRLTQQDIQDRVWKEYAQQNVVCYPTADGIHEVRLPTATPLTKQPNSEKK